MSDPEPTSSQQRLDDPSAAASFTVDLDVDGVGQLLAYQASLYKGLSMAAPSPGVFTVTSTTRSPWAIPIAVIFFPIGLLALWLLNRRETLTVLVTSDDEDVTAVRLSGGLPGRQDDAIVADLLRYCT